MLFFPGAIDYLTEALTFVPDFLSQVEEDRDDYQRYGTKAIPSDNFVMNSSDICIHPFPKRFSLLFQFKVDSDRFAVTLFEIKDQMSIVLDLCNSQLIIDFKKSSCGYANYTLSLKQVLEAGIWHKIGLSFSDTLITMFVNCELTEWVPNYPGCSVECNAWDHVNVGIMMPAERAFCSPKEEVECCYVKFLLDTDSNF